jgi:serine phosphatase RsbU (regulator of sigma subunit)
MNPTDKPLESDLAEAKYGALLYLRQEGGRRETIKTQIADLIEELFARDIHRKRLILCMEATAQRVHPDYGPCDSIADGCCSECIRVMDALKTESAQWEKYANDMKRLNQLERENTAAEKAHADQMRKRAWDAESELAAYKRDHP